MLLRESVRSEPDDRVDVPWPSGQSGGTVPFRPGHLRHEGEDGDAAEEHDLEVDSAAEDVVEHPLTEAQDEDDDTESEQLTHGNPPPIGHSVLVILYHLSI